jgi:DNA-binding response OmpR family regulator
MARILLIDDDDSLRTVLTKALGHAGYEVFEAGDGLQGLEVFRAIDVDLVVSDMVMPVQEGVETILKMRRERPDVPIIAISGGVTNSKLYLQIAGKMGADRVLPKPFTPQELIRTIEELRADKKAGGPTA